jgi:hypothetical protein
MKFLPDRWASKINYKPVATARFGLWKKFNTFWLLMWTSTEFWITLHSFQKFIYLQFYSNRYFLFFWYQKATWLNFFSILATISKIDTIGGEAKFELDRFLCGNVSILNFKSRVLFRVTRLVIKMNCNTFDVVVVDRRAEKLRHFIR